MKVVNLGSCRDLLSDWEEVRKCIVQGKVTGFTSCVTGPQNEEKVFLGGLCKRDKKAALKAAMNMSMTLNRNSDDKSKVKAGQR